MARTPKLAAAIELRDEEYNDMLQRINMESKGVGKNKSFYCCECD